MLKLPGATIKFVHETIRIMNMCHSHCTQHYMPVCLCKLCDVHGTLTLTEVLHLVSNGQLVKGLLL